MRQVGLSKQNNQKRPWTYYYYLPQTYLIIASILVVVTIPISGLIARWAGAPDYAEDFTSSLGMVLIAYGLLAINPAYAIIAFSAQFFIKMSRRTKRILFNIGILLWLVPMIWVGVLNYDYMMNTPPDGYPRFTF